MPLTELRKRYNEHRALVFDALTSPNHVDTALRAHALVVDDVLIGQWDKHGLDKSPLALLAVGGYGRLELFPHSDVDLLILHNGADVASIPGIERFLHDAWDLGFDIGHSVRSIDECLSEAHADATVATALLERRLICGDARNTTALNVAWSGGFDVAHFIKAKRFEQQQRYARFEDTAYNLEPNVKESPGGLRDVQMVLWLSLAINGANSLSALVEFGLLAESELQSLANAYLEVKFLRARLHLLAKRREDRLAFELQTALAEFLGLSSTPGLRASEVLMKRYYQSARRLRLFNDILIDALTRDPKATRSLIADSCFAVVEEKLDIAQPNVILKPIEILQAFRFLYRDRAYAGLTPALRRAILRSTECLPERGFADVECRALCLEFLRAGHGIYHALREMNELGVLGKLITPWAPIVGQMQHDLFHVYTVDQHILMVLRNMRRFADPVHSHEYPLCSELIQEFPEREVLYLACIFHDIAKGRGGDHSDLGMEDAREFGTLLGMEAAEVEFVAWLVQHHLTMSSVAQKKDIADPAVVREFANLCADEKHLVALYLLTVADIRGTSPKVWNNWKARLLEQLFRATRSVLTHGASSDFDLLADRLIEARRLLALYAIDVKKADKFWRTLDSVYLQRHSADEIAWHARDLFWRVDTDGAVVRARLMPAGEGLQVMVYVTDQTNLFARIMRVFARLSFSVLDARIHTSKNGYALDTFTVINPGSARVAYRDVTQLLEHDIALAIETPDTLAATASLGKATRQQRHFPVLPRIEIVGDELGQRFALEIVAADRPGLLARIAEVLSKRGVSIETARINTLGARAEDVFVVSGGRLAEESTRIALETELAEAIS